VADDRKRGGGDLAQALEFVWTRTDLGLPAPGRDLLLVMPSGVMFLGRYREGTDLRPTSWYTTEEHRPLGTPRWWAYVPEVPQ
jgi:hypothetical protein